MKALEKSKLALRKYISENKEKVKSDLDNMRKMSNKNIENLSETEVIWNINITSTVKNKYNLNENDIDEIIHSSSHEINKNFKDKNLNDFKNKYPLDIYPDYKVAYWQLYKSREINELYTDGISFKFNKKEITVSVDFDISIPIDWDKENVIDWSEGFNRVMKDYLFLTIEELSKLPIKDGKPIGHDDIKHQNSVSFLKDLIKNQQFNLSIKNE